MKQRIEHLEAQDRSSGAGRLYTVVWPAGLTQEQALAAYEAQHGPIDPLGLCVTIRKFAGEAACAA
jgi:hypothetical protein